MTLGNYFLWFMPASDNSCIVFTAYLGFIRCQFERSGKYYKLSYDSWNVYLPHHALFSLAVWDLYDANLKGVVFWPLANSAGDFHRGYFKPRTPARQCYSSLCPSCTVARYQQSYSKFIHFLSVKKCVLFQMIECSLSMQEVLGSISGASNSTI